MFSSVYSNDNSSDEYGEKRVVAVLNIKKVKGDKKC